MYPFDEKRKEVVKRSFGRVFDEVLGYLNLYDFMKLQTVVLTGKAKNVSGPMVNVMTDRPETNAMYSLPSCRQ